MKISHIVKHPLFSGSIILVIGGTIANTINYLYHLIVGRLLGPSSYGELAALISLSGFLGIIPGSIGLVFTKYVSAAKTEKNKNALIRWFRIKIFFSSLLASILLVISIPLIKSFLHITNISYVFAVVITFLFSLPMILNRSILQGLLKFKETIISAILENGTRFVVSIMLIYLGYSVGGAIIGLFASAVVGWYLSDRYLKKYIGRRNVPSHIESAATQSMLFYTIPVAVQSISLISLYSSDLILVKHFFSSHDAGIYAAISTLGKIIFFGAGPIGLVMFTLVSKRYSEGGKYKKIFSYSFLATLMFSITMMVFYWLFPRFTINLLYGYSYLGASNLLIWFGIFMTLVTLSSLLTSFHLSLGNTSVAMFPAVAAIVQAGGIWFYHENLISVIMVSILVTALLLSFLLIYSFHQTRSFYEKKIVFWDKPNIHNSSGI